MKNSIAVAIALLVVLGALFGNSLNLKDGLGQRELTLRPLSLGPVKLQVPNLEIASVADGSWQTFQRYLQFAKNHDLTGLTSASYQISETCGNPNMKVECEALMDSVYNLMKESKQSDFSRVLSDDRQIILVTDHPRKDGQVQAAIFFVRENGTPKVLSIQFCFETAEGEECFEDGDLKLDGDQDGWWDSIEEKFLIK